MGKNTTVLPALLSVCVALLAATAWLGAADPAPAPRPIVELELREPPSPELRLLVSTQHATLLNAPADETAASPAPAPAPGGAAPMPQLPSLRLAVAANPDAIRLFANRLVGAFFESARNRSGHLASATNDECIRRVASRQADIAIVSRSLCDSERNVGLQQETLGYFVVVPVVHQDNPVRSIFEEDMTRLLAADERDWCRLGWPAQLAVQPVCVIPPGQPDPASILLTMNADGLQIATLRDSESAVADFTRRNKGALGLVTAPTLASTTGIRALLVCHVEPTIANVERGAYHRAITYRLVHAGADQPRTRAFLDFVKTARGRDALATSLLLARR